MKTTLIIPFYLDKRKARRKEILNCLNYNLRNSLIDQVIAVCDSEVNLPYHKKLTVIDIGTRQKFSDLVNIGNSINPDGLKMVANADIQFDFYGIESLKKIDYSGLVAALSRWDIQKKGKAKHHNAKDSQDFWVWSGILKGNYKFEMGKGGIDNRVAYEIGLNYNIVNPSNTIRTYHLHLSGIRNYKKSELIPPPYLRVPCCYFKLKKIKKVLHIGLNPNGQKELGNMLKSFGKYEFIDWRRELAKSNIIELREYIVRKSNALKPDLIFMQLQTQDIIDPITASKLHGFVLNWTGDCRENINWLRNLGPYVDATCLTNETDTDQLRQEGINSWFLQIGFESKIFNPNGPRLTTKNTIWGYPDVVFMGNHYNARFPLSQERYSITKRLHDTYGNRFLLCGQGWNIPAINLMGQPKKEAMVYRSCKIAINSNHFIHKRFSSDRLHRIMGSGAFCLTRWYPGIEKDFIDGVHLKTFKNEDEMIYLINYYIENELERTEIAEAGCKLIHEKFTWMANKKLIEQIASFPQEKKKMYDKIITKPMSNKEWMQYINNPNE